MLRLDVFRVARRVTIRVLRFHYLVRDDDHGWQSAVAASVVRNCTRFPLEGWLVIREPLGIRRPLRGLALALLRHPLKPAHQIQMNHRTCPCLCSAAY